MASKRPVVVEGNTPGKPESKRPSTCLATKGSSRKSLFEDGNFLKKKPAGKREWSEAENSALVQYICLFWDDAVSDKWPMHRDSEFWDACASAVNKACNSSRTGMLKFKELRINCKKLDISSLDLCCFYLARYLL